MASKAAQKRLSKEFMTMQKDPPPYVWATPDEKDILTWYYIIRGPPDSPYAGGEYLGMINFPSEYPFKPPGIKMLTPSGRFHPDKKICFSMSDFHPGSWNPAWSVATILTGLLSFMLENEMTAGSMTSNDADKRVLATRSHAWNLAHRRFKECFPDYCTEQLRDLPNMAQKERGVAPQAAAAAPPPAIATAAPGEATATARTAGEVKAGAGTNTGTAAGPGWAAAWRKLAVERWRWGVVILAALLLSRLSS